MLKLHTMSVRVARNLFIRSLMSRGLSSEAAAVQKSSQTGKEGSFQVSKLPSGITLVSCEGPCSTSSVGVIVQAGSSAEVIHEAIGVSHYMRYHRTRMSTKNLFYASIIRGMERSAANFSINGTRDFAIYGAQCMRGETYTPLQILRELTTPHPTGHWEFSIDERLSIELAAFKSDPAAVAIDLIHSVAFRGGYNRSLYCPEYQVGKHSHELVQDFMAQFYRPEKMVIVGINVDHSDLEEVGLEYEFEPKDETTGGPEKSHYVGGFENRVDADMRYTAVCVATEGSSLSNTDVIAGKVLQYILASGPCLKYGTNGRGRVVDSLNKKIKNQFNISGLNANYLDSGLFGFIAVGEAEDMNVIVNVALKDLKDIVNTGPSEEEFARGKCLLKFNVAQDMENPLNEMQYMGENVFAGSKVQDLNTLFTAIDNVKIQDVHQFAKKLSNKPLCIGAYGDLTSVPHINDLKWK